MLQWFRKRRLWMKMIIVLTVVTMLFIANAFRLRMKLANIKARLESKGELIDIENLVQKRNIENDAAIKQLDENLWKLSHTPAGWQIYQMEMIEPGKG
jgi:hypothetical protein